MNLAPIKAFFFDLDGTLLDEKSSLPLKVREAIRALIAKGYSVYLASGRSFEGILSYHKDLGLLTPVIAYNGAQLVHPQTYKILEESFLDAQLVKSGLEFAKKYNVYIQFYRNKEVFYLGDSALAQEYYLKSGLEPKPLVLTEDFMKNCTNGMFLVSEKNCIRDKLNNIYNDLDIDPIWDEYGSIFFSSEGTLEFSNKGVSKGQMMKMVAKSANLEPKEILAIGDGENDIEMIQFAGIGIAMGNGQQTLKDKADHIIGRNIDFGVAEFLNKFFLDK